MEEVRDRVISLIQYIDNSLSSLSPDNDAVYMAMLANTVADNIHYRIKIIGKELDDAIPPQDYAISKMYSLMIGIANGLRLSIKPSLLRLPDDLDEYEFEFQLESIIQLVNTIHDSSQMLADLLELEDDIDDPKPGRTPNRSDNNHQKPRKNFKSRSNDIIDKILDRLIAIPLGDESVLKDNLYLVKGSNGVLIANLAKSPMYIGEVIISAYAGCIIKKLTEKCIPDYDLATAGPLMRDKVAGLINSDSNYDDIMSVITSVMQNQ